MQSDQPVVKAELMHSDEHGRSLDDEKLIKRVSSSVKVRPEIDQYYNDDYFTIITIIGPTINRSDASLKSIPV